MDGEEEVNGEEEHGLGNEAGEAGQGEKSALWGYAAGLAAGAEPSGYVLGVPAELPAGAEQQEHAVWGLDEGEAEYAGLG